MKGAVKGSIAVCRFEGGWFERGRGVQMGDEHPPMPVTVYCTGRPQFSRSTDVPQVPEYSQCYAHPGGGYDSPAGPPVPSPAQTVRKPPGPRGADCGFV